MFGQLFAQGGYPGAGMPFDEITLCTEQGTHVFASRPELCLLERQEMQELEFGEQMVRFTLRGVVERQSEEIVEANQFLVQIRLSALVVRAVEWTVGTVRACLE